MKLNLANKIRIVDGGLNPLPELLTQQRQLEILIFLTAFHSFKKTLIEIHQRNFEEFNKQPLFLSLDLVVGDYNTYLTPDLFINKITGINHCYSDDKDRNSFIVKYTLDLNKQVCYLESPNASNFAKSFSHITIDISNIIEINKLADLILSPKNNSLYSSAILDIELSEFPKELRKKLKL